MFECEWEEIEREGRNSEMKTGEKEGRGDTIGGEWLKEEEQKRRWARRGISGTPSMIILEILY